MTAILADQIMDELMERHQTATELAKGLGADWVDVVAEMITLQKRGLIEPVKRGTGHKEVPFRMKRTRRSAA